MNERPQAIEGFEFLEFLGEGAMGSGWKARRRSDGRLVALKLLRRIPELEPLASLGFSYLAFASFVLFLDDTGKEIIANPSPCGSTIECPCPSVPAGTKTLANESSPASIT